MDLTDLFTLTQCDICHKEKRDVRYADIIEKWVCSDCMGVKEFEVNA